MGLLLCVCGGLRCTSLETEVDITTPMKRPSGRDKEKSSVKKEKSSSAIISTLEKDKEESKNCIREELKDAKAAMCDIGKYTKIFIEDKLLVIKEQKLRMEKMRVEVEKLQRETDNS